MSFDPLAWFAPRVRVVAAPDRFEFWSAGDQVLSAPPIIRLNDDRLICQVGIDAIPDNEGGTLIRLFSPTTDLGSFDEDAFTRFCRYHLTLAREGLLWFLKADVELEGTDWLRATLGDEALTIVERCLLLAGARRVTFVKRAQSQTESQAAS
jgi:hypothetical protein